MNDRTNAQAALLAAAKQFTHRSTTDFPVGRNLSHRTTEYTESPTPGEVLKIADIYLRWLEEADKGTLEERISKLEGER